jgi:hypothetical protein
MKIYLESDDRAWRDPTTQNLAERIPYTSLRGQLLSGDRQQIIPFLGAGASLAMAATTQVSEDSKKPDSQLNADAELDALFEKLDLRDESLRRFVRNALDLAQRLQRQPADPHLPCDDVAPTATELAALLARETDYEYLARPARKLQAFLPEESEEQLIEILKSLAERTSVAATAPPLLSVASYFNHSMRRNKLWEKLHQRFRLVNRKTDTHKLIALSARRYFDRDPDTHYLIVTTNYDHLMEDALEEEGVATSIVTVDNKDRLTHVRFSSRVQSYLGLDNGAFDRLERENSKVAPGEFILTTRKPLAIVYKMHGSLDRGERERDSVIISDQDYVSYLEQNGLALNIIPAQIKKLMGFIPLLFLGYSFSDWNVRSFYAQILRKRNNKEDDQDYAVLKSLDPYEQTFFAEKGVAILMTSLDRFAARIRE